MTNITDQSGFVNRRTARKIDLSRGTPYDRKGIARQLGRKDVNIPGGYLEKFEEHFGPGPTKAVLIFITVFLVVGMGAAVYFVAGTVFGPVLETISLPTITTAIPLWVVLLFFLALCFSLVLARFFYKRGEESSRIRRLDNLASQLDSVIDKLKTNSEKQEIGRARDIFMDGVLSTATYSGAVMKTLRDPISGRFAAKSKGKGNPPQ